MARNVQTRRASRRPIRKLGSTAKGAGKEAKLCFMCHTLMENRNGLHVDACLTPADGHSERIAALHMLEAARRPATYKTRISWTLRRVSWLAKLTTWAWLDLSSIVWASKPRKAADAISEARGKLDGHGNDQRICMNGHVNLVPKNSDAICFRRTPQEVLRIVYITDKEGAGKGGFCPNGLNGTIRTT